MNEGEGKLQGGNKLSANFSFVPNQPCVVLPLADLHLLVSVPNLHLPHLCHMCQCPDGSNGHHVCHNDNYKAL